MLRLRPASKDRVGERLVRAALRLFTSEGWSAGRRPQSPPLPSLPHQRPSRVPKAEGGGARKKKKKRLPPSNPRPPALYNPRVCAAEDPRVALLAAALAAAPSRRLVPLRPEEGQGSSEAWREKGTEGRDRAEQYKSRFSGLYLTRCSNSSERQRERAGGLSEPREQSRTALRRPSKGDRSLRGLRLRPAPPPTAPTTSPRPRRPRRVGGTSPTAPGGRFALELRTPSADAALRTRRGCSASGGPFPCAAPDRSS